MSSSCPADPSLLFYGALQDLSPNHLDSGISLQLFKVCVEQSSRKHGQPCTKEVVLGPKRPHGWPWKLVVTDPDRSIARHRGRPSKVKGSGGVLIKFGKYVIPANSGKLPQWPLHQGPGAAKQAATIRLPLSTSCTMTNTSSMAPTQIIISNKDPECAADIDDDDDKMGEGLGEKDEDPDKGDERDDEREPGDEDIGRLTSSQKPSHICRPLPPWLIQAFKACTKQLEV